MTVSPLEREHRLGSITWLADARSRLEARNAYGGAL